MNIKLTQEHCILVRHRVEAARFTRWNFLYWRLKKVLSWLNSHPQGNQVALF